MIYSGSGECNELIKNEVRLDVFNNKNGILILTKRHILTGFD